MGQVINPGAKSEEKITTLVFSLVHYTARQRRLQATPAMLSLASTEHLLSSYQQQGGSFIAQVALSPI